MGKTVHQSLISNRPCADGSALQRQKLKTGMGSAKLPHSIQAEQGVLGSMLVDPERVIPICVEKLTRDYFFNPNHQVIYAALVEQWKAGTAIDLITFTQVLIDRQQLQ